jgi:hypothetical protein
MGGGADVSGQSYRKPHNGKRTKPAGDFGDFGGRGRRTGA